VTSKPDFKVMVLLLVFMQLTRDLFAIAKFLLLFALLCHVGTLFSYIRLYLILLLCHKINWIGLH